MNPIKEYLKSYADETKKVERCRDRIATIEAALSALASDGTPKGSSPGKPTERKALDLIRLKGELEEAVIQAEATRQKIAREIDQMPTPKYKELLYARYLKLLPWEKVAERLKDFRGGKDYELKSVIGYMHKKALEEFAEVRKAAGND